jgi:hypothetical protein
MLKRLQVIADTHLLGDLLLLFLSQHGKCIILCPDQKRYSRLEKDDRFSRPINTACLLLSAHLIKASRLSVPFLDAV